MSSVALWISGSSRSGKTTRLIELLGEWSRLLNLQQYPLSPLTEIRAKSPKTTAPSSIARILIFAANGDNRITFVDRLMTTSPGQGNFYSTTPLGFFQDEVILFWPLLVESLNLKAQFPLRLRPETEQELASQLWSPQLEQSSLRRPGVSYKRLVRQILDILQLAALSGTTLAEIPQILDQGFTIGEDREQSEQNHQIEKLLRLWRSWCLERGFLTYGLMTELYGQYLLNHPTYQDHLRRRFPVVLADDVDEYPALAYHLFELLLEQGAMGAFTYNPNGAVRLGLGADPEFIAQLEQRCGVETLTEPQGLARQVAESVLDLVLGRQFGFLDSLFLSKNIQSIQTGSRADLLRQTAEQIIDGVKSGQVQPHEIAVIAPGLDAVARYTLRELLTHGGIAVESTQEQRPLVSSPLVRALLSLLLLVYPGNGRLVDRDAIAEMLTVLAPREQKPDPIGESTPESEITGFIASPHSVIDPVRAGLLADHCFVPDPEIPKLLPVSAFPRWDRLGYQATLAYNQLLEWLERQRDQQQQHLLPSPVALLDRAIQQFLLTHRTLRTDQLSSLRELMETALHYWEVQGRLQIQTGSTPTQQVSQFVQLLRQGVVSANPYPVPSLGQKPSAITLATIFQYRSLRPSHRWHFWLDVGSPLWLSGGASTLWGAPLFLHQNKGHPWTIEQSIDADQQRLHRILVDLLSRVSDRLILCHSDLAVNGQEQIGPLLPLVHATVVGV